MHVNVKIAAVGDPPTFPEYRQVREAVLVGVSILEKGMQSGNCSAALHFQLKGQDGPHHILFTAQLSASMLMTLGSGARGAKERFGDDDL
jgi:hypothetical protein